MDVVVFDDRAPRLVAFCGIEAHAWHGAAIRVAPLRDSRFTDKRELIHTDIRATYIA